MRLSRMIVLTGNWESLHKGSLDHELPYGYAWFLKLAKEHEQGVGENRFVSLGHRICRAVRKMDFLSFR